MTIEPYMIVLLAIAILGLARLWYERRQQRREDEAAMGFHRVRQNYGRSCEGL